MSLLVVAFELRKRRVVSGDDASPPNWIPQNWISQHFAFSLQADAGLQEDPGEILVNSATSRHLTITVPRDWSPVIVDTTSYAAGQHDLLGSVDPPQHVYFAEGQEIADVGKWKGSPSGGTVVS